MGIAEGMGERSLPAYPASVQETDQDAAGVKICFMASGGGHFQELCGLVGAGRRTTIIFSFPPRSTKPWRRPVPVPARPPNRRESARDCGRSSPITDSRRFCGGYFRILLREKPDLVISTGAGIAVPGFLAARLLGIRTVYIESYARVESLSLAGKICYRLADRFLVQHACLANGLPRAVYAGSLNSFLDADSVRREIRNARKARHDLRDHR